jgi:putative Holliday junction resolvase
MRTLAIDLGSRRIGLAIGDESGRLATPLQVLEIQSESEAVGRIGQIAVRHDIRRLAVGVPLNMDETIGPAARAAIKWGRALAAQCNLPVIFLDERLSSFAADQSLVEQKQRGRKITRKQKKRHQDALAAADFLQGFLDGRLTPIDVASLYET